MLSDLGRAAGLQRHWNPERQRRAYRILPHYRRRAERCSEVTLRVEQETPAIMHWLKLSWYHGSLHDLR